MEQVDRRRLQQGSRHRKGDARQHQGYADDGRFRDRRFEVCQRRRRRKYTGEALPEKISNDDGQYTVASYQAYADAYVEAEQAFANPDELAKSEGEALLAALKAKKDVLVFDQSAQQRAEVALADAKLVYGEADAAADKYTTDSAAAYRDAMSALEGLIADAKATPKQLKAAQAALEDAEGKLVDASELIAARAEFKKTNGKLYTDESYNAYKAAFDDSAAALKNGTAEQVAAAAAKLNDAKTRSCPA